MPVCPSCSQAIPGDSRVCPYCAKPVAAPSGNATRSLATGPPPTPSSASRSDVRSSDSLDDARFAPGTIIAARYRVVGLLGRGGMGEVYRADDLTLRQPTALKFLPHGVARDAQKLERLLNEVRIARRVSHANVCRVFDVGESDGEHFISMEYVDGEDLASLIRRIDRLSGDKGVEVARQLCAGLAAAHDCGVTHRDLKPHNVMIDGQGRVRITDFGLAGLVDDLLPTGGTPAYMAPEQLAGEPATAKSDIYSLGLVLFEMFTGKPAFRAESHAELMRIRETSTVASLSSIDSQVDPGVARAIDRCVQQDPAARPDSPLAVAAMLPGGDPLAAALAAGHTPSPELVAAAGDSGVMRTGPAVLCVCGVVIGLVALVAVKSAISLASFVPLDKPPAVLADRARELLVKIGYAEAPADTARGYSYDAAYLRWTQRENRAFGGWQVFGEPQPAAMYFWYRQSPRRFRVFSTWHSRGRVSVTNPPWHVGGEAYVSLDLAGRLRRFQVVPEYEVSSSDSASEDPDVWRTLFEAAGLDIDAFSPTQPKCRPNFRVDRRQAWTGVYPHAPDLAIRVEGGAAKGKPVYFRFVNPWEEPRPPDPVAGTPPPAIQKVADAIEKWDDIMSLVIALAIMFGAGYITFSPQFAGRGDRRGAMRVAVVGYFGMLFGSLLNSDSILPTGADDVLRAMATATFLAMGAWMCYLALEPFVRRLWPSTLIAWMRLLSGRFSDPLVGKSVLFGVLVGIGLALIRLVAQSLPGWLGGPFLPAWAGFPMALAPHLSLAGVCIGLVVPLMFGFVYVLLLVLFRSLIGQPLWAGVVFVLVAMVMLDGDFSALPWGPAALALSAIALLVLFLRFGVLAAIVGLSCDMILSEAPLLADLSAWYGHATWIPLGFVGALAVYGFLIATAGRPFRILAQVAD